MEKSHKLLKKFDAPEWCKGLRDIPQYYVKLAQNNTPLYEWKLDDLPNGFKLGIKRDDMTGNLLSGNKVRKLEFLLGDAISQNCDTVITCGTANSNHCRTTSIAAKQLGLDTYLIVNFEENGSLYNGRANSFLTSLTAGSHVRMIDFDTPYKVISQEMEELAQHLRRKEAKSVYVIARGGASYVGMFGYINCFQEMMDQNVLEDYTDIFVTCGSTGTATSLAVANYLTGSKLKIHAVSVSRSIDHAFNTMQKELDDAGLDNLRAEDIVDVMKTYQDEGYGISTKEELDNIVKIAKDTGVLLDPVYTIKCVRRMFVEMRDNPQRFKGKKVLFIHTGGTFALFDHQLTSLWQQLVAENNNSANTF